MKLVYHTIDILLKHKNWCTYSEISKVSGLKSAKVLEVLNKNKHLFSIQKDTNKINGWNTGWKTVACHNEFEAGKTYKLDKVNYNSEPVIQTKNQDPKILAMIVPYYCGGLGDSYQIQIIKDTPENIKVCRDLGLISSDEFYKTLQTQEEVWDE